MISVILPCYNEIESVARYHDELFPALEAVGEPYEVVAVDDGSTDGTAAALNILGKSRPLRVLTHEKNRGLGAALRTGLAAARGEWVTTLDADLSFNPGQIRQLVACQKNTGADLVAGSPYLESDGLRDIPWRRRLASLAVNAFYRGAFSPKLTAYTPIFRLYRAAALKPLLGRLRSEGFEINAELAALFVQAGRGVAETPATLTPRQTGASKFSAWRELPPHLRLIARLLNPKENRLQ